MSNSNGGLYVANDGKQRWYVVSDGNSGWYVASDGNSGQYVASNSNDGLYVVSDGNRGWYVVSDGKSSKMMVCRFVFGYLCCLCTPHNFFVCVLHRKLAFSDIFC